MVSTRGDWRYAALIALAVAAWALHDQLAAGRPWDALVIEASAALFLAAVGAFALAVPDSPLRPYAPALAVGWIALTAWGSLAAGRPFTLGIARQATASDLHETALFRRVNSVVTAVWATSFTLTAAAAALLLHEAPHAVLALLAVKAAGFTLPDSSPPGIPPPHGPATDSPALLKPTPAEGTSP
ncbi:hypothetical protein [Streptomyces spinoverrucosus]|uniref:hypothetical protein n=1 Tax=Streptomyces spinoverrucosus TaxID=284043 RepID=UPI001E644C00|nr:hypothetical protein [Streptomyces spinoverrucosus]